LATATQWKTRSTSAPRRIPIVSRSARLRIGRSASISTFRQDRAGVVVRAAPVAWVVLVAWVALVASAVPLALVLPVALVFRVAWVVQVAWVVPVASVVPVAWAAQAALGLHHRPRVLVQLGTGCVRLPLRQRRLSACRSVPRSNCPITGLIQGSKTRGKQPAAQPALPARVSMCFRIE
jgi:hypothetical protein